MIRRGRAGFTLIEVLVALVIVAVGMAALLGALSSSADTVSYMRDKTFAEWVALNQIETLRIQMTPGQLPPVGTTNGDLDYAGRSWHWRQEIQAISVPGILRIDVKVRPAEVKAGDDNGWFVTVSGLVGDAVARPGVVSVNWDGAPVGSAPGATTGTTSTTVGAGTSTQGNSSSQPNNSANGGGSTGTTPPVTPQPLNNSTSP